MAVPCRKGDLVDDPDFRARATEIMLRHARAILDSVHEISNLGLVRSATAEIRLHSCPPMFKLCILNNNELFSGFYPIREHIVPLQGEQRTIYDLMGKEAVLFRCVADSSASAVRYVDEARAWFDSMWNTISRVFSP
jgi:hypothetical protein